MIKYETTIKEAIKIKKLGFDLSFACEKFVAFHANGNYISSYFETDDVTTKYHLQNVHTTVPIIPYLVLGQCLIKNTKEWDKLVSNPRTGKLYAKIEGEPGCYIPSKNNLVFDNIYESFIYCITNYPEETKERFEIFQKQHQINKELQNEIDLNNHITDFIADNFDDLVEGE